jgi:uncharacterized protein GlcG (DUF336 family)
MAQPKTDVSRDENAVYVVCQQATFSGREDNMNTTGLARRLASHGLLAAALTVVTLGTSVQAAELPSERILPLTLATKAALAALEMCRDQGYRVSVAVVDQSGVLKTLARADGAGPHTVDSSRRKAYTASSLRRSTQELAELVASRPEILGLRDMNESILILGGGLPIRVDGEFVGGIGVGGAPGAKLDEACALAGLAEIEAL